MEFNNGRKMWEYYNKPYHYDPMVNLHLAGNTSLQSLIKNKTLGNSPSDEYLICQARDFLLAVRVHDPLVHNMIDRGIYERLGYLCETEEERKLFDDWDGFTQEGIRKVIDTYIGLLDPLTMTWQDTQDERCSFIHDGRYYLFKPDKPVDEIDTTFCYQEDNKPYENLYDDIIQEVEDTFVDMMPEALRDIYYED